MLKTHPLFNSSSEIFQEFANTCTTPIRILSCNKYTSLKQALQNVNAAALAGVWLLFEGLHKMHSQTLLTLNKEIQMVQQQFIIAELSQEQPEEGVGTPEDNPLLQAPRQVAANPASKNSQNIAIIERSHSSIQIKRKKTAGTIKEANNNPGVNEEKEGGGGEAGSGGAAGPEIDQKLNLMSKTCFGIFATIPWTWGNFSDSMGQHQREEQHCFPDCLKGAFRITSMELISVDQYLSHMLKCNGIKYYKEVSFIAKNIYEGIKKAVGEDLLSFRRVSCIIKLCKKCKEKLFEMEISRRFADEGQDSPRDESWGSEAISYKRVTDYPQNEDLTKMSTSDSNDRELLKFPGDSFVHTIEKQGIISAIRLYEKGKSWGAYEGEKLEKLIDTCIFEAVGSKFGKDITEEILSFSYQNGLQGDNSNTAPITSRAGIVSTINNCCENLKLLCTEQLLSKIQTMNAIFEHSNHVLISGAIGSGKSTLIAIYLSFLYKISGKLIKKFYLNPDSESPSELLPLINKSQSIINYINKETHSQSNFKFCFIIDCEIAQTAVDLFIGEESKSTSNKKQASGILLSQDMKLIDRNASSTEASSIFIYETVTTSNLSPGSISDLNLIHLDYNSIVDENYLLPYYLQVFANCFNSNTEYFNFVNLDRSHATDIMKTVYNAFCIECWENWIPKKNLQANTEIFSVKSQFNSTMKILTSVIGCIMRRFREKNILLSGTNANSSQNKPPDVSPTNLILIKNSFYLSLLYSIIWANLAYLQNDIQRQLLLKWVLQQIEKYHLKTLWENPPKSLYDIFFDMDQFCFRADNGDISNNTQFSIYDTSSLGIVIAPPPQYISIKSFLEIFIHQPENIAFLCSNFSDSTLYSYLNNELAENYTFGYFPSSNLMTCDKFRSKINEYYTCKKKNIASPLTWKSIVFIINDIHMMYPGHIQALEFMRMWITYKGIYDGSSQSGGMGYKNITDFRLLMSVNFGCAMSSLHLRRLISSCIKLNEIDCQINAIECVCQKVILEDILCIEAGEPIKMKCKAIVEEWRSKAKVEAKFGDLKKALQLKETVCKLFPKGGNTLEYLPAFLSKLLSCEDKKEKTSKIQLKGLNQIYKDGNKLLKLRAGPYLCFDFNADENNTLANMYHILHLLNLYDTHILICSPLHNGIPEIIHDLSILINSKQFYCLQLAINTTAIKEELYNIILNVAKSNTPATLFINLYVNPHCSYSMAALDLINMLLINRNETSIIWTNKLREELRVIYQDSKSEKADNDSIIIKDIFRKLHIIIWVPQMEVISTLKIHFPKLFSFLNLVEFNNNNNNITEERAMIFAENYFSNESVPMLLSIYQNPTMKGNSIINSKELKISLCRAIVHSLFASDEAFLISKSSLISYLVTINTIYSTLTSNIYHKQHYAEQLLTVCKMFTEFFDSISSTKTALNTTLANLTKEIQSKAALVQSMTFELSNLDTNMESRRVVCTDADNQFKNTKEKIDAQIAHYYKIYSSYLRDLRMMPLKQYILDCKEFPPGLNNILIDLLSSIGKNITINILNTSQAEVTGMMEEAISWDLPKTVAEQLVSFIDNSVSSGIAAGRSNSAGSILMEMLKLIKQRFEKKIQLSKEYIELNRLQKLTEEHQSNLINIKKNKDKMVQEMVKLEEEINKHEEEKLGVLNRKEIVDQQYNSGSTLNKYLSKYQHKLTEAINGLKNKTNCVIGNSIILAAEIVFFASFDYKQRKQFKVKMKSVLDEMNSPLFAVTSFDDSHDDQLIELYSLCLDQIEDYTEWHSIAISNYVYYGEMIELFFHYYFNPYNAVVLYDSWGIFREMLSKMLSKEDTREFYGSKLCSITAKTQIDSRQNLTISYYDIFTKCLNYDSNMKKVNELIMDPFLIKLPYDDKRNMPKSIFMMPNFSDSISLNNAIAGFPLLNCSLEPGDPNELWIGINKIFYKNLLPEMHDDWNKQVSKWQAAMREKERIVKIIDKQVLGIISKEDLTIETLELIGKNVTAASEAMKAGTESSKAYQELTTQHQLLASFSNALAIVSNLYY